MAKVWTKFVSPFVGRLDDISRVRIDSVGDIIKTCCSCDFTTQVLAVSIRHPLEAVEAAKAGADVATMFYTPLENSSDIL